MASHSQFVYDETPKTPTKQKNRVGRRNTSGPTTHSPGRQRLGDISSLHGVPLSVASNVKSLLVERQPEPAIEPAQTIVVDFLGKENRPINDKEISVVESGKCASELSDNAMPDGLSALKMELESLGRALAAQSDGLSSLQRMNQVALKKIEDRLTISDDQSETIRSRLGQIEKAAKTTFVERTDLAHMELQIISHGQQLRSEIEELRSAIRELNASSSRRLERDAQLERVSSMMQWIHALLGVDRHRWWQSTAKVLAIIAVIILLFRWRSVRIATQWAYWLRHLTQDTVPRIHLR